MDAWVVSILLAFAICGAVALLGWLRQQEEPGGTSDRAGKVLIALSVIALVLWAGGHTAYRVIQRVEEGHVGVVYQGDNVVGLKGEGLQFIAPWQKLHLEGTGVQEHTFTDVNALSADTLDVIVSVTVVYRVDPAVVEWLHRWVGPEWFNVLVEPRVFQFFKAEVVRYEADEVVANAEEIQGRVGDTLAADMEVFSISVEGLQISDWTVWNR